MRGRRYDELATQCQIRVSVPPIVFLETKAQILALNDSPSFLTTPLKVLALDLIGGTMQQVRPWSSYIWCALPAQRLSRKFSPIRIGMLGTSHQKNASSYNDSILVLLHMQRSPTSANILINTTSS
jgi:hypothetical protein